MSKKYLFVVSLLLAITTFLVACSETEAADDQNGSGSNGEGEYELVVNNWTNSNHHYSYNVYEPWKELVEEKTDGRVTVTIHHGSSIGKSSSVYQDVSGGLYDLGFIVANYFYDTGFFPYTIGNLPFAFEGPEEAAKVLSDFGDKYAAEKLEDVEVLPGTATDGYDLFATEPITSVDDLQGKKMRVNGKSENAYVEALGGTPVSLSTEDTYEGLERGMVDTAFYTQIGAVGLSLHEPAPYITKFSVSVTPIIPIMNKEFLASLPDDLQTLFKEELNPKLTELLTESYATELESSHEELKGLVEDRGEFIELGEDEMEEFRELGTSAWDAWIEDANSKGYDGQQMVDDFMKMLEEEGLNKPF